MAERQPRLDVVVRDVEMRRHDADDRAPDAVDLDLRADDARVAAERRLPGLVRKHGDRRAVRQRLGRFERAAEHRADAEHLEQAGGDAARC